MALSASHSRAADSTRVSSTACRSMVEPLMTFSTSDVALCCSSASSRSRVGNSTFLFRRAAAEPRRRATLGVLRRLVMRRRFPLLRRLLHARSDRKCGSRALKPHTKFPLRKLWTGLHIDINDYFDRGWKRRQAAPILGAGQVPVGSFATDPFSASPEQCPLCLR